MMHNNLFLHRLLIYTDEGKIAYDEQFHKGINIIRGNNSSGKSTITHFIFYVLGGDFIDFVPEAKQCTSVYAEVEMNNARFTIRREIESDTDDQHKIRKQVPMYFYWGMLEESLNPQRDGHWQKFGYRSYDNQKSFSNVIFENLDIPIVKGDSNITIHQILRLLYIDQESPTGSLFYYEHFDSQLTRETVADLLLGVYNENLYESKKRLLAAEKEYFEIKSERKATKQFFSDPLTADPEHVKVIIENKAKDIDNINEQIISLRNSNKKMLENPDVNLNFQQLNESAIIQRKKVLGLRNEIDILKNEIEDSEYFIETLKSKIIALRHSIKTRDFLGGLPLEYCPECLTRIVDRQDNTKCKLCKETIDGSFGTVQARRMEQEISFQINESTQILEFNKRTLFEKESSYEAELVAHRQLQRQVNAALNDVKSQSQEELDRLLQDKGFIEGEILQYRTLLEYAEIYSRLLKQESKLKEEIDSLDAFIRRTEKQQETLKVQINEGIRTEGVYLLNNDLDRQDDFKKASDFYIDFSNNIAFLSSKYARYSASSNFYLKVSARFAIFLASLKIEKMRYPRFIFADNMEDKGIEKERAQNLQRIIIQRLEKFSANTYQLIYTTSYITDELNSSPYVVGDFYTKENPSLKNINRNRIL
jgi:hypothetical protein